MSFFRQVFFCCLGRPSSPDPETDPLLHQDLSDRSGPIIEPPSGIPSDEETLAELIRETESKMVNVQDPHPFLLRPPPPRSGLAMSQSHSRTPSPSRSYVHDNDASDRSASLVPGLPPREPVLNVKLIRTYKGKARKINGKGRGRDRTRVRDGSPLIQNGDTHPSEPIPKAAPLSRSDDELLSSFSKDVQRSLIKGFRLHDSGQVVVTWDDN